MDLIVSSEKGIKVECLEYGYKKENLVSHSKTLQCGDVLTISNKGKYVVGVGWFVLISVNKKIKDYMWIKELEEAIHSNKAMPIIDCMLDYFNVSFQLDRALESRNKQSFLSLSEKKTKLSFLYDRISGKLPVGL
ncbi:hypothetical protein D1953_19780 [Peribacillus asahii]|uniref:IDEAL domain-containing protein n=1 Tax=Peribacillus asahii TaxID=228899 RepID=A0A398AW59_9BACI|nr:hypothetical protein [Peribacillus asahii]RID81831.1 hypothetical protein D1953_19780 [Peribacillus asahii]